MQQQPSSTPGDTSASPSASTAIRRKGPFAALAYPNYRYFWAGTVLSNTANWMLQVALGWLTFQVTQSAFITGAVLGLRTLPFLFASPVGGVLADRMSPVWLTVMVNLSLALLSLWFALMIAFDQVQHWSLFLFSILSGIGWAINDPVRQSLVSRCVPNEDRMSGITLFITATNVTRMSGPALGGYMLALVNAQGMLYLQAVLFLAVVPVTLAIRLDRKQTAQVSLRELAATFSSTMVEGVRYVWARPITLAILATSFPMFLFLWSYSNSLLPVFTEKDLHRGADALGLLVAVTGVGGILGSLASGASRFFRPSGRTLLIQSMLSGIALVAFALATTFPLALAAMFFLGVFQAGYLASINVLLQSTTPDAYRGRVMSFWSVTFSVFLPGSLMAGGMADGIGASWAMVFAGGFTVALFAVFYVAYAPLRRLRIGPPPEGQV